MVVANRANAHVFFLHSNALILQVASQDDSQVLDVAAAVEVIPDAELPNLYQQAIVDLTHPLQHCPKQTAVARLLRLLDSRLATLTKGHTRKKGKFNLPAMSIVAAY